MWDQRRLFSVFVFIAALLVSLAFDAPAQAAGGTITIVSSGGSTEGTNWTYTTGTIASTASVSINTSDLVTKLNIGSLRIEADAIVVNANIVYSNSNSLTFVATDKIIVGSAITIQSQGGNLIFQSDSDSSNSGNIRLGNTGVAGGTISSNGGNIIFGGGSNPLTGRAMANSGDIPSGKWASGFSSWGYTIDAGGGNIQIRAGSIDLNPYSSRPLTLDIGTTGTTLTTTGSGSISADGEAGSTTMPNPWSVAIANLTASTQNGAITFTGLSSTSGSSTNKRGIIFSGTNSITSSGTGNISFIDLTSSLLSDYRGIYNGSASTISTGGDILIQGDKYGFDGPLTLNCKSATIKSKTTSFAAAMTTSNIVANGCNGLLIGDVGNTAALTINNALTVNGPITINSGALTISSTVTATDSLITLNSSGVITQTGALLGSILETSTSMNPQFRKNNTLYATVPKVPGLITFYANGKKISGCISLPVSTTTATCNWKPSARLPFSLTATFKPAGGGTLTNAKTPLSLAVVARSGLR